tara:strand:- start:4034 stop:4435 length:402 start_codon:yes stop_codon:yes gene_type:complete
MAAKQIEEGPFSLRRTATFDFIEGLNRTKEALREQGFDITTSLDVSGPVENACAILGIWDADLLRRALSIDPAATTLFPFSVSVHDDDDGIVIRAVDPTATLGNLNNHGIADIAAEVRQRLMSALSRLPAGPR